MEFRILTSQDLFFVGSASLLSTMALEATQRDRRTACVVGAVTCSVSYLECVINGLYEHAGQARRPTKLQKALASVWSDAVDRQRVLTKYQIALAHHCVLSNCGISAFVSVPFSTSSRATFSM